MAHTIYLPRGRKVFYHCQYVYDRQLGCIFVVPTCVVLDAGLLTLTSVVGCCCQRARSSENLSHLDGKPADLATFRQAWSNECPYVIITSNVLCSVAVLCNCFLLLLLGSQPLLLVAGPRRRCLLAAALATTCKTSCSQLHGQTWNCQALFDSVEAWVFLSHTGVVLFVSRFQWPLPACAKQESTMHSRELKDWQFPNQRRSASAAMVPSGNLNEAIGAPQSKSDFRSLISMVGCCL